MEGCNIADNIILAQEVIHSMRMKKGKKSWMTTKVDIEKAYDKLKWDFIEDIFWNVGLPEPLIHLIMHYISSCLMQLVWNEEVFEEFIPFRGIR